MGVPVLAAILISNLPEGLSSAAGMKQVGRSARYRDRAHLNETLPLGQGLGTPGLGRV